MRIRTSGPLYDIWPGGQAMIHTHTEYPNEEGTYPEWGPSSADSEILMHHAVMEDMEKPPPPCGFKPCEHRKIHLESYLPDRIVCGNRYTNAANVQHTFCWEVPKSIILTTWLPEVKTYMDGLALGQPVEFTHDDFWRLSNAWTAMQPQIKPDMDLLVFLAEIDELPKLAASLAKKVKALFRERNIKRIADGLKLMIKAKGTGGATKVLLDKGSSKVAGQWLEFNFAIAPLVDDIIGMVNAILSFDEKLATLQKGADKPQKASKSFTTIEEEEPITLRADTCNHCPTVFSKPCLYWAQNSTYEGKHGFRARVIFPGGVTTRIGMTVFYRYSLPNWVAGLRGKISSLASSLGLSPGLDTIWELVPFSFVLDWVYPVQSILANVAYDPTPVKTEVLDICFTKRLERPILIQGRVHPCLYQGDRTLVSGKLVEYKRVVGSEFLTKIPSFRWPNWFQLSLGAALAKR